MTSALAQSADKNLDAIKRFMRKQLNQDSAKGPVRILTLKFHGRAAERDPEIDSWIVRNPGSTKLAKPLDVVADEIHALCEEQTENVGGLVQYRLFAYAENSGSKAVGSVNLRYFHESEEETDADGMPVMSEELGTQKGKNVQDARHLESMHRMYIQGQKDNMAMLKSALESTMEHNATMMGKYVQLVATTETMLSQSKQRELMENAAHQKQQAFHKLADKVAVLIPYIANKALGMPLPSNAANPEKEMLRSFFESITQDQFVGIMSTLNETQRLPIQKIFEVFMKEEEEKKLAEAKNLATSLPSTVHAPKQVAEETK